MLLSKGFIQHSLPYNHALKKLLFLINHRPHLLAREADETGLFFQLLLFFFSLWGLPLHALVYLSFIYNILINLNAVGTYGHEDGFRGYP